MVGSLLKSLKPSNRWNEEFAPLGKFYRRQMSVLKAKFIPNHALNPL
jgi:hypothetical protein